MRSSPKSLNPHFGECLHHPDVAFEVPGLVSVDVRMPSERSPQTCVCEGYTSIAVEAALWIFGLSLLVAGSVLLHSRMRLSRRPKVLQWQGFPSHRRAAAVPTSFDDCMRRHKGVRVAKSWRIVTAEAAMPVDGVRLHPHVRMGPVASRSPCSSGCI